MSEKNKLLKRFLVKTGIIAGIITTILIFVLSFHRMSGNNMFPFFQDGDLGVFYKLGSSSLNDVVLYNDKDGNLNVGRIVAAGRQTIKFREDGGYEVNGYETVEEIPYETHTEDLSVYPLTLKDDEFFILNDFRSDSNDSRQFGPVKSSDIKGKMIFLFRCRDF